MYPKPQTVFGAEPTLREYVTHVLLGVLLSINTNKLYNKLYPEINGEYFVTTNVLQLTVK